MNDIWHCCWRCCCFCLPAEKWKKQTRAAIRFIINKEWGTKCWLMRGVRAQATDTDAPHRGGTAGADEHGAEAMPMRIAKPDGIINGYSVRRNSFI